MKSPAENKDFDPSNIPAPNVSPLQQNQEAGSCITQNANEMSFSNPVNNIRDMHEEDRARAQNMSMLNLMQPPIHPFMTRNIGGGTFQSHTHPLMVNIDNLSSGGTQPNIIQRPHIDRNFFSARGNMADELQPSSQWYGMGTGTNFRPDSVTFSGLYEPQIDGNMITVGDNMNGAYQMHDQQELMVRNQVRNAVPSNNPICPEQTLNLGFGDDKGNTFPSNICVGLPLYNGMPVTPDSFWRPQVDGSSLRLGGNFGDLSWSNYNSGNTFGTNAGSNPVVFDSVQRTQGDMLNCYPTQGSSIAGTRSNRGSRNVNLDLNRGPQAYSGAASRPISSIQAQRLANMQARQAISEQARQAGVAQLSNTISNTPTQIPNEILRAQMQAHLNNTRSIHTNPFMVPPFVGTVGSTSGRDQSVHTGRPFDASVVQGATEHFTNIADMRKHVQQANRGTPVPCKGKRSPAEGSQSAQSSKVLIGVSNGKPVPVPVGSVVKTVPVPVEKVIKPVLTRRPPIAKGKPVPVPVGSMVKPVPVPVGNVIKPVPVPVGNVIKPVLTRRPPIAKGKSMPPTSAIPSYPRNKRTPQIINQPTSSPDNVKSQGPTLSQDYIRWKDPSDSSPPIEEKCALCKRNLTFEPDPAPYSQPSIPPEVAILPCGHTFHDECLQRITPPEECKDPPCIPCALALSFENP